MTNQSPFERWKERKLERLRLGQATCEIVTLLDDAEQRVALVPLTEAEYSNSLHEADKVMAGENPAGAAFRDEVQRQWLIFYATRIVGELDQKFFPSVVEVVELGAHEINHLYDVYLEMVADTSPALVGLSESDFNALKTVLPRIAWSELSGPQWYAADRFLNSIREHLLTANYSGSQSTLKSTKTSDDDLLAASVDPSKTDLPA